MGENGGEDGRIYIREASEILDRKIGTLRGWESVLPEHLLPKRGNRGWRYWNAHQIEEIKIWMESEERRPGNGIPHIRDWMSDPESLSGMIDAMRKPRTKQNARVPKEHNG